MFTKNRYSQVMFISYIKLNTINLFRGLMDKALDYKPKGREFESCCRRFFNYFFYLLIYSFMIIIIKLIFCLNFSFRYVLQNWHNSLKFDCIKTAAYAPLTKYCDILRGSCLRHCHVRTLTMGHLRYSNET